MALYTKLQRFGRGFVAGVEHNNSSGPYFFMGGLLGQASLSEIRYQSFLKRSQPELDLPMQKGAAANSQVSYHAV